MSGTVIHFKALSINVRLFKLFCYSFLTAQFLFLKAFISSFFQSHFLFNELPQCCAYLIISQPLGSIHSTYLFPEDTEVLFKASLFYLIILFTFLSGADLSWAICCFWFILAFSLRLSLYFKYISCVAWQNKLVRNC